MNYMKNLLLILSILFLLLNVKAQGPNLIWQHAFGGNFDEHGWTVEQDVWGNFYFAGSSASHNDGDIPASCYQDSAFNQHSWIIKTDSNGNVIWSKCYNTCGSISDLENVDSTNFIFLGTTCDWGYSSMHYGIIDTSGNSGTFNYSYGGPGANVLGYSVSKRSDNSYWGVGTTNDTFGHGAYDGFALFFDSLTASSFFYGGSYYDEFLKVIRLHDNNFLLVGSTFSSDGDVTSNHGSGDWWVVKIDSMGTILWQKTYGGSSWDAAFSAVEFSNHQIAIAGWTMSNDGDVAGNHSSNLDAWIIMIDSTGNIIWQRCMGGLGGDAAYAVCKDSNERLIIGASAGSNDGDVSGNHNTSLPDFWIVKMDTTGNIVGSKCFGGSSAEYLYDIKCLPNGLICVGSTETDNDGDVTGHHYSVNMLDMWTLRIDADFSTSISQENYAGEKYTLSPNPFSDKISIDIQAKKGDSVNYFAELKNPLGQSLSFFSIDHFPFTLDLSSYSSGIYFLLINQNNMLFNYKIIKH